MRWGDCIAQILLPKTCLGCGLYSKQDICFNCLSQIQIQPKILNRSIRNVDQLIYCEHYSHVIKSMIHQIKFNARLTLIPYLSERLIKGLSPDVFGEIDAYVLMPSHANRIQKRGYDWIELLFNPWIQHYHLSTMTPIKRFKNTPALFDYDKKNRERLLENVFEWVFDRRIDGTHIVICDDILSSGTTVSAYAAQLKAYGAAKISVLSLAYAGENH